MDEEKEVLAEKVESSLTRRSEHKTIGVLLRERREERGLSLKQISNELQIPLRFLEGLEGDQLEIFPAKVYAKGFLRRLVINLGVEEKEALLREFDSEWEVAIQKKARDNSRKAYSPRLSLLLTPKRIGIAVTAAVSIVIVMFLLLRLSYFIGYPELNITSPAEEGVVVSQPIFRVTGKAEKESRLTVNQRELRIDANGHFDEKIELQIGLNTLEFLVENRFGKERRVVRYIVVQ